MFKKIKTISSLLFIIAVLLTASYAIAVYRGTKGGPINTIMALGHWSASTPVVGHRHKEYVATGSVVDYKGINQRCFATAAHIKYPDTIVMGENVVVIGPGHKDQNSARQINPGLRNLYPWRDIAVVWAENKLSDGADLRIGLGDYAGVTLGKAEDMGIAPYNYLIREDIPAGRAYKMNGYGNSNWYLDLNNSYVDIGAGILRFGFGSLLTYVLEADYSAARSIYNVNQHPFLAYTNIPNWSNIDLGAIFVSRPGPAPDKNMPCSGDSGMPLYTSNGAGKKLVGVHSQNQAFKGFGERCGGEGQVHFAAAFNSHGAITEFPIQNINSVGNYELMKYMIQEVCTKILRIDVRGPGKVSGSVQTDLESYNTDPLDKDISCERVTANAQLTGDCIEYIHQPENITLLASSLDPGYKFGWWESFQSGPIYEGNEECQCHGSRDEECPILFQPMGIYTKYLSNDNERCRAVFIPIRCGDGEVDPGEECDEGENNGSGACDTNCTVPTCGDGEHNAMANEECDDGNLENGDCCDSSCQREGDCSCGDGYVNALGIDLAADTGDEETCDDGTHCEDGTACDPQGASCSDGSDCVSRSGDGCSDRCVDEECQNGIVEVDEECDSGEETLFCDSDCTLPECGDNHLNTTAGEECDDGNTEDGDGCSSECKTENGSCGDGNLDEATEFCDTAGHTADCDNDCTDPVCGDGVVNIAAGEECDEIPTRLQYADIYRGRLQHTDLASNPPGCSPDCRVEGTCGDGRLQENEECDDGNATVGDGCSDACEVEHICGDLIISGGEECDDGNTTNGDGCDALCVSETTNCGNGELDPWEACDDGNVFEGDGCNERCQEEICGNGVLDYGETCDDPEDPNWLPDCNCIPL